MWQTLIQKLSDRGSLSLKLRINPGAKETFIQGRREDGVYKVNVAASPEKGKANQELIKFVAKELGVSSNNVTIEKGHGDKNKLLKIKL